MADNPIISQDPTTGEGYCVTPHRHARVNLSDKCTPSTVSQQDGHNFKRKQYANKPLLGRACNIHMCVCVYVSECFCIIVVVGDMNAKPLLQQAAASHQAIECIVKCICMQNMQQI